MGWNLYTVYYSTGDVSKYCGKCHKVRAIRMSNMYKFLILLVSVFLLKILMSPHTGEANLFSKRCTSIAHTDATLQSQVSSQNLR